MQRTLFHLRVFHAAIFAIFTCIIFPAASESLPTPLAQVTPSPALSMMTISLGKKQLHYEFPPDFIADFEKQDTRSKYYIYRSKQSGQALVNVISESRWFKILGENERIFTSMAQEYLKTLQKEFTQVRLLENQSITLNNHRFQKIETTMIAENHETIGTALMGLVNEKAVTLQIISHKNQKNEHQILLKTIMNSLYIERD